MEACPLLPPPPPTLEDLPAEIRYDVRIQLKVATLNIILEKKQREKYGTHL
jgi:hypothetical protein